MAQAGTQRPSDSFEELLAGFRGRDEVTGEDVYVVVEYSLNGIREMIAQAVKSKNGRCANGPVRVKVTPRSGKR
jgi:hypothetical protein